MVSVRRRNLAGWAGNACNDNVALQFQGNRVNRKNSVLRPRPATGAGSETRPGALPPGPPAKGGALESQC